MKKGFRTKNNRKIGNNFVEFMHGNHIWIIDISP